MPLPKTFCAAFSRGDLVNRGADPFWWINVAQNPEVQAFMQQLQQGQQGIGPGTHAGTQRGSGRGGTRGRGGHGGGEGTRLPQQDNGDDFGGWAAGSQEAGHGQSRAGSSRRSAGRSTRGSTRRSARSGHSGF